MNKNDKDKLDAAIFAYFHARQTESEKNKILELSGGKFTDKKMHEILSDHYYLAPKNLRSAQILLACLSVLLTLALIIVRVSSDSATFLVGLLLGSCIGIPYLILYGLFNYYKSFSTVRLLSNIGLWYTLLMSLIFVFISVQLGLTGVVLIPIIIFTLYFVEVRKLSKLIKSLK